MVSPEHNNLHWNWPEEETSLSSAEEQQAPTVVEEKRPWQKPLMQVVGTVLSVVGSFAGVWVVFVIWLVNYGIIL